MRERGVYRWIVGKLYKQMIDRLYTHTHTREKTFLEIKYSSLRKNIKKW